MAKLGVQLKNKIQEQRGSRTDRVKAVQSRKRAILDYERSKARFEDLKGQAKKMIWMISQILQNKFDCVIIIEGNRGLGKSTLGIHLLRGIAREMKKQGKKDYKFNWRNSMIYTKKETKTFGINGDHQGLQMK